jgi:hypothetical protein
MGYAGTIRWGSAVPRRSHRYVNLNSQRSNALQLDQEGRFVRGTVCEAFGRFQAKAVVRLLAHIIRNDPISDTRQGAAGTLYDVPNVSKPIQEPSIQAM